MYLFTCEKLYYEKYRRHFSEIKLVGKGVEGGGGSYCLTVISNILSLYSKQRRD